MDPQDRNSKAGVTWHRTSRHTRGYGTAWTKLRKVIIERDQGLCQPCARKGRATPYHAVDHIKPKAQGGTDDPANLECTCAACHTAKTTIENGGRVKPRIGVDGWPVG